MIKKKHVNSLGEKFIKSRETIEGNVIDKTFTENWSGFMKRECVFCR